MAAVAPAADQATELLQKLSLDSQAKGQDAPEVAKKPNGSVDHGIVANVPLPSSERSVSPFLQDFIDPNLCYVPTSYASPAYYYGAYDGSINKWEDYSRYVNPDEISAVYGDMYHHSYGYAPYGPYAPPPGSPVPTTGQDGQLYGHQHYQYPGLYYPTPTPTSSAFTPSNQLPPSQVEVSTPVATDAPTVSEDATKTSKNGVSNGNANCNIGTALQKPNHLKLSATSNSSYARGSLPGGMLSVSGYQPDQRYAYDGARSPIPWLNGSAFPDGQHRLTTTSTVPSTVPHVGSNPSARSQNLNSLPRLMGLHTPRPTSGMGPGSHGLMSRMYPNSRMYGQYGSTYRTGLGYGSNGFDSRTNGHGWYGVDAKNKPRSRGGFFVYGNENLDLGELNRGPRSGQFKSQKGPGPNVTIAVKGQNFPSKVNNEDSSLVPDNDMYNKTDFPEKYPDAKFFVIKSYSEDDVHKSIKYNVWASTASGNKKLDAAYQESKEKTSGCPVFLFFSVNTSGQFVGVAEMLGPVDFNKTVEYWQQDRWNGCFPVKWHIIKDVPNNILKHITLENNDNKPVTNSRDTQDVKLEQGLQVLKLFKEHVSKTSILDDFQFYELRQKTMQEKRAKQQQFQKQVHDRNSADVVVEEKVMDATNGKSRLQKPLELASVLNKEPIQGAVGECKPPEENGMVAVVGEAQNVAKLTTEKKVVANGVANG
uniref:YTH domain-containing family protein n=1 Tax=Anthurium amnicola TaxID=1678845 RepID=A0A1D1ZFG8_9ARAE